MLEFVVTLHEMMIVKFYIFSEEKSYAPVEETKYEPSGVKLYSRRNAKAAILRDF